jgi:predicted nucleic-acid-binding protein
MIAIDTNVLVRVLINDPTADEQCMAARNLISTHGDVWVSWIVLVETVWVFESVYAFSKDQIISALEKLIQHPHVHLESSDTLNNVLTVFSASNADFSDCLILNEAQYKNLILYTFDRKLSRLHGAKHVESE